ncbi:MAG: response regulator, partial [Deltaproteobacteria bacterium]
VYFVFFVTGSLTLSHIAQKIHITPNIIGSYFLITSIALIEKYRKKFHTFWSWYIILGAILVNNLTLYFAGGINAPGLVWMIIIAAICDLLFVGKRKYIPLAFILASIVYFRIAVLNGSLPPSLMNEVQVANIRMISSILACFYMFFFMNLVRKNLNKKRLEVTTLNWKNIAYSAIFDSSDDMIGMSDSDGNIIFHNRAFISVSGIDPSKEKSHVKDFHPEWALEIVTKEGLPTAREKGTWTGETAIITKDGREIPTLQTIIYTEETDEPVSATIIKDISILKEREQKLKKENQARLVAEKEADKASKEKSLFLANMSHEIRTPLHSIIGMSEILFDHNTNPENERSLQTLKKASNHLLGIVNDILDISKIQAGQLELEERFLNPIKETEDLVDIFTYPANEKGLKLLFENKLKTKNLFKGDKTRIRQIISNLISNAIKFTSSGHVIIDLDSTDNEVIWKVKDTGIGIAKKNLDSIFSQFKQESAATNRRFGGTGLGLSISKTLAEMMGGSLSVSSVYRQGTTFELRVPVLWKSFQEITMEKADLQEKPLDINKGPYEILCVDDSEDNTFIVEKFLENTEFKVTSVYSGPEAISLVETKPYSLILMDSQMPELDGNESTRRIRKIEEEKQMKRTPIIAFSASATPDEIQSAIDAGSDEYLTKPVTKDKLLTTLREVLSKK